MSSANTSASISSYESLGADPSINFKEIIAAATSREGKLNFISYIATSTQVQLPGAIQSNYLLCNLILRGFFFLACTTLCIDYLLIAIIEYDLSLLDRDTKFYLRQVKMRALFGEGRL